MQTKVLISYPETEESVAISPEDTEPFSATMTKGPRYVRPLIRVPTAALS
jgi:hypothetical protein